MVVELMTRKLIPQQRNANKHTLHGLRLLEKSIQSDGFIDAQTAAADGEIISGSARLELSAEKFADVEPIIVESDGSRPVVVVRTDIPTANDPRAKRLSVAANQIAKTDFNPDGELLAEWGGEDEAIREMFSDQEWVEVTGEEKRASSDENEIPADRFEEVAKKWQTADKQLWKVGEHFIYCGDSLNAESIEKVLQGQEPVLVIADPPYGVSIVASNGYVGGGESAKGMIPFGGVQNRRGTDGASKPFGSKAERGSVGAAHVVDAGKYPVIIGDESTETAKKAIELYLQRFDNAYHVWWGANYYVESLSPSPCWLVWNKETTGNFADCELAWTNADMSAKLFTHKWNGMLRDSEREKRWHPTQKPAALAEWSMGLFTDIGDVSLDPFGGAGWSLIGAQNSNRKACIIEKSHEYIAVQLERMATAFPALEIKRLE
jgi:hypothetical protein